MTPIKSRHSSRKQPDSFYEMNLEESFRYVNFLLIWYKNKSSVNLANIIVSELEQIKQRIKDCEDGSKDKECRRLIFKALRLFSKTKEFEISWQG